MATVNNLSDIVDNGLCIGCGLCQSIAGKDKIEVSMSPKGRLEPKEIKKITPETFNILSNISGDIFVISLGSSLPLGDIETSILSFPAILWQRPQPMHKPLSTMSERLFTVAIYLFFIGRVCYITSS